MTCAALYVADARMYVMQYGLLIDRLWEAGCKGIEWVEH